MVTLETTARDDLYFSSGISRQKAGHEAVALKSEQQTVTKRERLPRKCDRAQASMPTSHSRRFDLKRSN